MSNMGIKGLFPWIKKVVPDAMEAIEWSEFENKTVCLDASMTMHRFARSQGDWLRGLVFQVTTLKRHHVTPIYCLDGPPPPEKEETIKARKDAFEKASKKTDDAFEAAKKSFRITDEDVKRFKKWCGRLGVQWIRSAGEADALMVKLVDDGIADALWSEDGDLLAYGCGLLLRQWKGDSVQVVRLDTILKSLQWSKEDFTRFCVLLGTDYAARTMGPATAQKFVTGSDSGIPEKVGRRVIDPDHIIKVQRALELFHEPSKMRKIHHSKTSKKLEYYLCKEFPNASTQWLEKVIEASKC